MVERSRRRRDMNEYARTRMLLTTAVFAAVAALLAGPANAFVTDGGARGDSANAAAVAQPGDPGTIPYLSHGIGVDESLFQGEAAAVAQPGDPGTIPYLSHGIGVDESLFQGESLGLTGDSARTRVSAPEPEGLTGDSALTRYPGQGRGLTVSASTSDDTDWTWFGVGAGMAALVAAGLAGVLLTSRRRGPVALP
jgi:hypothetical protein